MPKIFMINPEAIADDLATLKTNGKLRDNGENLFPVVASSSFRRRREPLSGASN